PTAAAPQLEKIREHAMVLLPKLRELTERGSLASNVHNEVLQTLTRYLPDTMAAYLRLPAAYKTLHRDDQGRSPDKLLTDQLQLLEDNLERTVKDALSDDIARLEVQGRFLAEKYTASPA